MKTACLAWTLGWLIVNAVVTPASAEDSGKAWQRLPPTPSLPRAARNQFVRVDDVRIWFAVFGEGEPVILLHGGLASSDYWGKQVPVLAKHCQVIVIDSRGHGRSTRDGVPFTYHLMARDVIAVMDFLQTRRAAVVGWSDGANIGLDLAIYHPERMTGLFAFAGNARAGEGKDASKSEVFNAYVARTKMEYAGRSTTPNEFESFRRQLGAMWKSEPNLTPALLNRITVPTWIVDGDHDELFPVETSESLAKQIPGATLLIEKGVSHFAFLQDPKQFNEDLLRFLRTLGVR